MTTHKPRGRPFKPGASGNPNGRPSSATTIAKLRASIAKDVPEIITALLDQAKGGDAQAARLLLERVLPPVKAMESTAPIELPEGGTLSDQGRAVLNAAAAGVLAPGQAAQLLSAIGSLANLVEADELDARITALEKANAKN